MNRTGDQTCFLFSCCDRDSVSNFAQADLKAIWVNTFLPSVHNPLGKRTDERICPPFVRGLFRGRERTKSADLDGRVSGPQTLENLKFDASQGGAFLSAPS